MASIHDEARTGRCPRRASELDHPSELIGSEHSAELLPLQDWLSGILVYDGLTCIGRVLERGGRHAATDAVGHCLGEFPSRRAATAAIVAAHRDNWRAAA